MKYKCDHCGELLIDGDDFRLVRKRSPGKATVYLPGLETWCRKCRAKNHGRYMLINPKPATPTAAPEGNR